VVESAVPELGWVYPAIVVRSLCTQRQRLVGLGRYVDGAARGI
jgi:hypothetical protein